MKLPTILNTLQNKAGSRDDDWYTWLQQKGFNSLVDFPYSPLKNPFLAILVLGVLFIVLSPAIVLMFIGTNFKSISNQAFVAMGIYAALIILALPVTLGYAVIHSIRKYRHSKQLLQQYSTEHPERIKSADNRLEGEE